MAYDKYTTEKVFRDSLVNIYCNKIFEKVHTTFAASEVKFVATGDLGEIIQGAALIELPVISFVTNDPAIYDYLVRNIKSLVSAQTQLSFSNRIQLVTSYGYFEIWLDETMAATVNVNGLYCRDTGGGYDPPVSPYNIILAEPQVFTVSATNEFYFQGWSVDKELPVKVLHLIGDASPAALALAVAVEDVFKTQPAGKYTSFTLQSWIFNWYSSAGVANDGFVTLGGDANGVFPGSDLLANELDKNMALNFANLNLLTPGQIKGEAHFIVHGVRSDSGLRDLFLTSLIVPFDLRVLDSRQMASNVEQLHLPHIKTQAPLPGQNFEVITGIDFEISIPEYFEVTGGNIQPAPATYKRKWYTGTGRQTLTIALTADFDLYEQSVFNDYMELRTDEYRSIGDAFRHKATVLLTAYSMEAHGFIVNPQGLEFFSIKGIESANPQELEVVSTADFVVTHPFWLQVSPVAGGHHKKLSVEPISSSNLGAGNYQGVISIVSNEAATEVPVLLKVVESIDEGFSANDLNFTDDNKVVSNLYSDQSNERALARLNIVRYDFNGFPLEHENTFIKSFFKFKATIHLGEIIARRFKKIDSLAEVGYQFQDLSGAVELFRIISYYKPASVGATLQIEDRSSGGISQEENFTQLQYVKGRTPKQFQADYGILNYDTVPVRVTQKSQLLFNFIRRFSQHLIEIYRNDALYKTITHSPGGDSLFGLAMIFKDFTPGDVIDVRLAKNEQEKFVQQYYVFPEQPQSNHIVFENEYGVLESYEFTGEWNFSSKYSAVVAKTFKDLVEHVENLETTKEQRLVINTGWILKSNQVIIDAISRAKRAWFVKDGKEISLSPVPGKDLTNEDSKQALYQYDVEFIINRENDLEVYTS